MALSFINEGATPDIRESVLRDTQKVFSKVKANHLTADTLFEKLKEDKEGEHEIDYVGDKITKRKIGDALAEFQIRSKPHRHKGGTPKKCWFREDFEEMWERYA